MSRRTSSNGPAGSWPLAAGPMISPRSSHRGPSTPMNLTGAVPLPGAPGSTGTCAKISVPNGPSACWARAPDEASSATISSRTSSQSALLRGAANACTRSSLAPPFTVTQTRRSPSVATSISSGGMIGTRRLPKSARSRSGYASPASHGPPPGRRRGAASSHSPGDSSQESGSSSVSQASPAPAPSSYGYRACPAGRGPPRSRFARLRRRNTPHAPHPRDQPPSVSPSTARLVFHCALPRYSRSWSSTAVLRGFPSAAGSGARVAPCRPESAVPPRGPGERIHLVEDGLRHPLDDELGDPVAAPEADPAGAVRVEERDLDLAPVTSINGTRRVDDRDPVPGSQARPRMDERRVSRRQGDGHAGWHE